VRIVPERTPPPAPSSSLPPPAANVLTGADFQYLGYYDIQTNGGNTGYAQGLTHRYVNGELRFLSWQLGDRLDEISITNRAYGTVITEPSRSWSAIGGMLDFKGLWWDEAGSRLWSVSAVDYTGDPIPVQIYTRRLNDNGSVSEIRGPVGLAGIPAKRVYGGVQPVPESFQRQYGVGPFVVGWGGYTSLVAQGGAASLGPTIYAIPNVSSYANNALIPASAFKTILDCSSGSTGTDWYKSGSPSAFDRGVRLTRPINYFDSGDSRQNPSTPPSGLPVAGAQWLSPAPDGLGRFVWGDSYYNTGQWIEGPNKRGFIMIASLGAGKCWYGSSTLHYDSRVFELHIFDPAHLGEAAQGKRAPWSVKPAAMVQLNLEDLGRPWDGNSPVGNVGGATYDSLTKRLYVMGVAVNSNYNRLYVYQVNS
jgi:hypothetical protein